MVHTGGVSEGVAALAAAGVRVGMDVSVAIPRLPRKEPAGFGGDLEVIAEYTLPEVTRVLACPLPGAGEPVRLLLVEAASLSERSDPYGEDSRDLGSAARAALFCRAIGDLVPVTTIDLLDIEAGFGGGHITLTTFQQAAEGVQKIPDHDAS